ncbi:MAG: hypothetical protein WCR42_01110 [bacterium]
MNAKSFNMTLIAIVLLLFLTQQNSESATNWTPPQSIVGNWSGKHLVVVRTQTNGKYNFTKSPGALNFNIIIYSDGKLTGTLGTATFEGCVVYKNRGWIGRTLNLKTDFVIKGKLVGPIFPEDAIKNKTISMPLNLENNTLKGSLFQMEETIDKFPMVDVRLSKEKK